MASLSDTDCCTSVVHWTDQFMQFLYMLSKYFSTLSEVQGATAPKYAVYSDPRHAKLVINREIMLVKGMYEYYFDLTASCIYEPHDSISVEQV